MTMFDDRPMEARSATYAANKKECKPDYEAMILAQREELERRRRFYDAIFEFNGRRTIHGKSAELVGELVGEIEASKRIIEELIAQQEKDTGKD